jgi:NADH-quinone oxidoreductase subunit F/NAD(P)H dehydrogenase (quinone)/NADP-reducing hydrogenase subunit HndC
MPKLTVQALQDIKGRQESEMALRTGEPLKPVSERPDRVRKHLLICGGTACHATKSVEIKERLSHEIAAKGLGQQCTVIETGCNGFCAQGPVMVVQPDGVFYQKLQANDVEAIVNEHLINGKPVQRLLYVDPATKESIEKFRDVPFFSMQFPLVLKRRGSLDAESIDEYIAQDGYAAVKKSLLEMTPEQITEEMKSSGLRGRGGAGFPTGLKWEFASKSEVDSKYVLCNADEGDPGAFMDRSILEADPHAVLEGMLIAGRAVGADAGYIYCRAEYPLAVRRINLAIEQARAYGLLGEDILGSGFQFDVEVYQGAGAFVCGEETALMQSIEGKRGMPRPRPPFPALEGLWKKPTVLNNVETFANVPQIILNGSGWYASIGTESSKGTKVFALTGDITNVGLVEVPMGTPLRTIVYDIGGGIPKKRRFKAVQLGGPSGGCIPEDSLDTPVDFESITKLGAIMGSGGMIVMDHKTCMVDMARFFMEFIQEESCGKCTPCREGTKRMLEILERITQGMGQPGDIELLEDMSAIIKDTSLCGLGQTGPNPVLSTLQYFREEYEAHIYEKSCPARSCPSLVAFVVNEERCEKCGMCFKSCPANAIEWKKKETAYIDRAKCIKCMACFKECPFDAID